MRFKSALASSLILYFTIAAHFFPDFLANLSTGLIGESTLFGLNPGTDNGYQHKCRNHRHFPEAKKQPSQITLDGCFLNFGGEGYYRTRVISY